MTVFDLIAGNEARNSRSRNGRIFGVVVGIVTNNEDPDKTGRIKIKFPWLNDEAESQWARMATPMAGPDRGMYFLPEVDDEVLVAFAHGDVNFPYIIGALWNGKDKPPAENKAGKNDVRMIKSRSGHVITLNDEDGQEKIEIQDKSEANKIIIDTSEKAICIEAEGDILLKAGGTIELDGDEIKLKSGSNTTLKAGADLKAEASGTMTIKGSTVNIN